VSSGVDRDGQPRTPRRYIMSRRGNDRVRRYLGMAALSAICHNPAVRALYRRVVAKHPGRKAVAVGHAMRKLLHLAFAIWKSGQPFDPQHYAGEPARAAGGPPEAQRPSAAPAAGAGNQAAGHTPEAKPAEQVVTAACAPTVAAGRAAGEGTFLDFAHLKSQLPLARVLEHLGLASRLRGTGPQRRGACPLHRGDGRGRTFSVNLDDTSSTASTRAAASGATSSTCGPSCTTWGCARRRWTWRRRSTWSRPPPAEQRRGTVKYGDDR
jgi:hypothetical protein